MTFPNELVSIIIPTVRQWTLVRNCLESLRRQTIWRELEIIVVDDGSAAAVQQELTEITRDFNARLILKETNTGFASTVNLGVANACGHFLCLVNNDICFSDPSWLKRMMETIHRNRVGVVGAKLIYPDGRIQHGGVCYLPNQQVFEHRFRFKPAKYPSSQNVEEVLAVTGALMLIRREVWESLNGMAEEFFIAYEDVDFCLRARKMGWRIYYNGQAVAIHAEGATRGSTPDNKDPEWYKKELSGYMIFRKKWFGPDGKPCFPLI